MRILLIQKCKAIVLPNVCYHLFHVALISIINFQTKKQKPREVNLFE